MKKFFKKHDIDENDIGIFICIFSLLLLLLFLASILIKESNVFNVIIETNEYSKNVEIIDIKAENTTTPISQVVGKSVVTTFINDIEYSVIVIDSDNKKYEIKDKSLFEKYKTKIGLTVIGIFKEVKYKNNEKDINLIDLLEIKE